MQTMKELNDGRVIVKQHSLMGNRSRKRQMTISLKYMLFIKHSYKDSLTQTSVKPLT